jgi:hypothetical protein
LFVGDIWPIMASEKNPTGIVVIRTNLLRRRKWKKERGLISSRCRNCMAIPPLDFEGAAAAGPPLVVLLLFTELELFLSKSEQML